jgi:1-deoxyxylulose-5-phosphate synthase
VLQQPGITSAIIGASRPEQLDLTLAAPELTFDEDARAAFDAVWWSIPRRPVGR